MEFHHIVPHDVDNDGEGARDDENPQSPDPPIWSEVSVIFEQLTFFFYILDDSVTFKLCHCYLYIYSELFTLADYAFLF